jgi:hypothetical protein
LKLGVPVTTNPFDALMRAQAEANGDVEYFRRQVEQLDPDAVFVRPTSILRRPLREGGESGENPAVVVEEITSAPLELNIAYKALVRARAELVNIAKTIAQLGLMEQMVALQERGDRMLAEELRAVVEALGHDLRDAKVEATIRRVIESASDSKALRA